MKWYLYVLAMIIIMLGVGAAVGGSHKVGAITILVGAAVVRLARSTPK